MKHPVWLNKCKECVFFERRRKVDPVGDGTCKEVLPTKTGEDEACVCFTELHPDLANENDKPEYLK